MRLPNIARPVAIIALVLSSMVSAITPVLAQTDAADEAKRRVNLAGRQRMLSQRISKAACFIQTGVEADTHQAMLDSAFNLFASTHDALRLGDASLGLGVEVHPPVILALAEVDTDWNAFSELVSPVIEGQPLDNAGLETLDRDGLVLLRTMNRAVGITARAYGDSIEELPLILAITIDLAGRQRMFTQKMAKEFCLIDAGINPDANRESLAQTQTYFNVTLQSLIDGYAGVVVKAPNDEIRAQLEEVQALWAAPNAVITQVLAGGPITDEQRRIIANETEAVLVAMNEAVGMYEFVDALP